jgi:Domain of unknown function (DUF4351)
MDVNAIGKAQTLGARLVLRLLNQQFGELSPEARSQIQSLSLL